MAWDKIKYQVWAASNGVFGGRGTHPLRGGVGGGGGQPPCGEQRKGPFREIILVHDTL